MQNLWAKGDVQAALEAMQRTKGSMSDVLRLTDAPEIDDANPEFDHMRLTKCVSAMHLYIYIYVNMLICIEIAIDTVCLCCSYLDNLLIFLGYIPDVGRLQVAAHLEHSLNFGIVHISEADEDPRHWALELLDGTAHLYLPPWLSQELEVRICMFVNEREKWQEKIEKRAVIGKNLAPKQQQKYDAWCLTCDPRLVFSKSKQELITESAKVKKDCISIQLHLSDEANKLRVTASSGNTYRLVLLRGQHDGNEAALQACGACQNASLSHVF